MAGVISQADIATDVDEERVGELVEAISAAPLGAADPAQQHIEDHVLTGTGTGLLHAVRHELAHDELRIEQVALRELRVQLVGDRLAGGSRRGGTAGKIKRGVLRHREASSPVAMRETAVREQCKDVDGACKLEDASHASYRTDDRRPAPELVCSPGGCDQQVDGGRVQERCR
jgi:hypothetical protein